MKEISNLLIYSINDMIRVVCLESCIIILITFHFEWMQHQRPLLFRVSYRSFAIGCQTMPNRRNINFNFQRWNFLFVSNSLFVHSPRRLCEWVWACRTKSLYILYIVLCQYKYSVPYVKPCDTIHHISRSTRSQW